MAKKITLDFSKVEERSGWNTKEMPEGLHEFKIELVDLKDANDGTTMWTYGLRPTNPKYKTRLFPYYCKHQQNQYFKLRDIFVAAGIDVPKKKVSLDPEAPVGKIIAAEVTDSSNPQYQGRSEIDGVYDRSIIDDEDREDVDDEDEVEDDEVEDEEYDDAEEDGDEEDDEEDDDELREELEGLTLAALRKRAKGLGIDTTGVKQPELIELVLEEELGSYDEDDEEDDDEDLGDEELDDEDFDDEEDEEEEPEPAPRRRPVAKKAAPAAAAPKRTVRRR